MADLSKMSAEQAYLHTRDVVKGRCPEVEPIISKDAEWAYRYANRFIKGRWVEAEPSIFQDAYFTYHYVASVIRHRCLEAEKTIKQNAYLWSEYCKLFGIKQTDNVITETSTLKISNSKPDTTHCAQCGGSLKTTPGFFFNKVYKSCPACEP